MVNIAKKLTKKHLYIIITSLILAILIAAYIVINALFNSGAIGGNSDPDTTGKVTYDESIGESQYLGTPTAYPYVKKDRITKITIDSHARLALEDDTVIEDFVMQRPQKKDSGEYLSYFIFRYKDADSGEYVDYMPNIMFTGEKIDYDDLYAVETSDGLNATKIEYLCAMIGALYFQNKVELKAESRDEQLKMYGLDAEHREMIALEYLDADGKLQEHKVYIGDKLITGAGYYYMIDGRDMIYASAQSERLSSVLFGFEKLVNSRIVASSFGTDGSFEPYLTTGYKQWTNTYTDTEGMLPAANSLVIFNASTVTPDYGNGEDSGDDGYILSAVTDENMLNLNEVRTSYRYAYISKALSSMGISKTEGVGKSSTVLTNFLEAELYDAEKGVGNYTYTITAIEAVYTGDNEVSEAGAPVLGASRVKVTYSVTLDGKQLNSKPYHAVIDLDTAKAIPDDAKQAILASSVGTLSEPIVYDARYEQDKANTRRVSFRILSVNQIYKMVGEGDEQTVEYQEKIDGRSIVYMSVCYVLTDEYGKTETTPTDSFIIDLSKITEGDDLIIKNAILGMGAGESDKSVELGRKYYQDMQAFEVYDVKNVVGFMEQDITVAFKFINDSYRDDFYGESTYANILSEIDSSNKYAHYALNVENCDRVVRILGGISADGTSSGATGLVGTETVAVGLTSEVMRKYKLYEGKTVSFGLPRGIDESPADEDDYIWDHELTFTLYISPVQYGEGGEKFYYIGSDMYDIVVKFVSDELDYLDYSFAEFWARRNMVMISSENLDKIELDFKMSDLYGSYEFDINHKTIYILAGEHYDVRPEEGGDPYDFITVYAGIKDYEEGKSAALGKYTETALSRYLVSLDKQRLSLAELYNRVAGIKPGGNGLVMGHDTAGTGYYKETLRVMFATYYMGVLSADDIAAGEAKESIMKMSFTVKSSTVIDKFVYEFIRLDDRRIMVSFYREDDAGKRSAEVNDFYITDFAFKKIVYAYTSLLSGTAFDTDTAYGGN